MKILYAAIDQRVPGSVGGSVHVVAVASGLAQLGHSVHTLVAPGSDPFPPGDVCWHAVSAPFNSPRLRLLRLRRVLQLARAIQPDVVMERYHNFGGEGLIAARHVGAGAVLEVNAPVVDHPGSAKRWLDRALLIEPLRRWREWQCATADLIVTPSPAIIPASVPRQRVLTLEWGADTRSFHPGATGPMPFERRPGETIAVFVGAFRRWHGARHLARAVAKLHARGRHDVRAILIGDGPELATIRADPSANEVTLTGPVAHDYIPGCLAAADVGVAPFDVATHPPLALDFFWSPLKIFEYMAAGLPVVAPAIDGLRRLVEDGREGILYDPDDADALARALERLTDPALRARLGAAARERAVREYGWDVHCRLLDQGLARVLQAHQSARGGFGASPATTGSS